MIFSDILNIISSKGYGIVGLKNDIGEMSGVITDGDVRRYITKNTDGSMKEVMFGTSGKEIMTKSFVSFEENQSCAKILSVLEQKNISSAFVLKNGKPLGLISMLMLIQAGVA